MPPPELDREARNAVLARVVSLLAASAYEQIAAMAPRSRVTAAQMRSAIEQYGRSLVPLPPDGRALIDYVAIDASNPMAWSVVVPLFTREEGRSDLSLLARIVCASDGQYEVEVDDIRVL